MREQGLLERELASPSEWSPIPRRLPFLQLKVKSEEVTFTMRSLSELTLSYTYVQSWPKRLGEQAFLMHTA